MLNKHQKKCNSTSTASFTLVELLIVIGILAILGTAAVIVINPAELMKQTRDATRVADLQTLNKALSMYQADGNTFVAANIVYISLPDNNANCGSYTLPTLPTLPTGWSYSCKPAASYRNVDGTTGWLPINLTLLSSGSPLATLPIDPVNDGLGGNYYTFVGGSWELTALMESDKYHASHAIKDNGTSLSSFEVGSDLRLTPSQVEEYKRDTSLVGYWTFDESSGTNASDISGTGNNGTLINGPLWGTGLMDGGLIFDGSNDYVNAGSSSTLKVDNSSFTVGAWIKPAAELTTGRRYTVMSTYSPGWIVDLPDDGDVEGYRFYNGSSAYKYIPPSTRLFYFCLSDNLMI
ncbi:MAG: hypothetical protein V1652_03785 [bacterium]